VLEEAAPVRVVHGGGHRLQALTHQHLITNQVAVVRIRMFLGLLDPDPLVRVMDQDPSVVKQKKVRKTKIPTVL
jgi:hypothetical protein